MSKLNFKSYTLDKTFEIKGIFSTDKSELPAKGVHGILDYSPNEIVLELFGSLNGDDDSILGFNPSPPTIYGFTNDGKILILNCYGNSFGTSSAPGFPLEKHRVKNFKIYEVASLNLSYAQIIDKLEDEVIYYYDFSFDNLDKWIGKSVLEAQISDEFTVKTLINEYETTKVHIVSEDLVLEDMPRVSLSVDSMDINSRYNLRLRTEDNQLIEFEKCDSVAKKIKEFVEVISATPLSFIDISFLLVYAEQSDGKHLPLIKGKYFFQHTRKNILWKQHSFQDITMKSLNTNFETIINSWFDKSEKFEFIVNQYTKNLHSQQYLEDKLLDSIRNLEVYARNFADIPLEKPSEEEKEERTKIFNFINVEILEVFRQRFRNKLKFNRRELTLSEKLNFLLDKLPYEMAQSLDKSFSEKEEFIQRIVQTRNYYTHGDNKERYPKRFIDVNEMYDVHRFLQKILHYYIYSEIGIEYKYKEYE